jgi:serine/threonine-protein kinase
MGKYPVTTAEYLAFLNDLVAQGRETEAMRACPRRLNAAERTDATPMFDWAKNGEFMLQADRGPALPVTFVDWYGALAYSVWLGEKTALPWRLPNELEREKAARGTDARLVPWGNHLDATFACVLESHQGVPGLYPVDAYAGDESVYGIRGLAGNVRDWCINLWKTAGPLMDNARLQLDPAPMEDNDYRIIRGGAWGNTMNYGRAATRFGARPGTCWHSVGVRLTRFFEKSNRLRCVTTT